ncbi:DNRLRE domain-containing protein [Planifilum fimeticola]
MDNDTPGQTAYVGSWPYSTNVSGYYGSNYQPNDKGSGDDTYTWVPRLTESGTYQVDVWYTSASDRATNAPYTVRYNGGSKTYTVNQQSGGGKWHKLGSHSFSAGTSHSVVLNDNADGYVIADAVRFIKYGTATWNREQSNTWHRYSIRSLAQDWINGTQANHGVLIKMRDETLGQGGVRYAASQNFDENAIRPKLVLVYGKPGVVLEEPTTVYGTGAELHWTPYDNADNDFVEYQVHRSIYQNFTPSPSTLVAPIQDVNQTTFTDTTAEPTRWDNDDPDGNAYYYKIVVKTKDGDIPSNSVLTRLPKAGIVKRILQGSAPDTILSSGAPTQNRGDETWLQAGTGSATYGTTRSLIRFDTSQIPDTANVILAELNLWTWYEYGDSGTLEVYPLNRAFGEKTATWNQADSSVSWTSPGGDYAGTPSDTVSGITNDPKWRVWDTTSIVQDWVKGEKDNYGFLLKKKDEATAPNGYVLFLSEEAEEPELSPKLVVYYTDTPAQGTYHAPYTPSRMVPGNTYTVDVTLTNTTSTTWSGTNVKLSYHWTLPDGTDVTTGGNRVETELKPVKSDGTVATEPVDVAPGETITVRAQVKTPIQSDEGNKREAFVLKWDLIDTSTGKWLSQSGGPPTMDQEVIVEDPKSNLLGMEKYYQYVGKNTGAGSATMVNLASGNTVFSYDPFTNPSLGPATFLRFTYNSQDTSDSVLGYGWSLSASSLHRLGTPLDLHPLKIDQNEGTVRSGKIVLTDGDGTSHEFEYDSSNGMFKEPPGVNLYLQLNDPKGTDRKWVMTRPDRARFFFDEEGYLTAIQDKNGNELVFTYEERKSNNKPTKFLRYLTDATGRRTLTLDYYTKEDTNNPHIIDKVKEITDIAGRKITFTYSDKGLLTSFTDGAGAGDKLEKTFEFTYDATQGNKNVKLVSVKDPRGNTTELTYYEAPEDPKNKWKLKTITDRLDGVTQFAYAPNSENPSHTDATVTDALDRKTKYLIDDYGKPIQITNAKNETTKLAWDADFNVTRLEEPNGAVTTWTYDNNGLLLTETDAVNNAKSDPAQRKSLKLEYRYSLQDPLGKYHVADLIAKTSPEGRKFTFTYDDQGNLLSVTDPKGNTTPEADDYTTKYTYYDNGLLKTETDANGNVTTYGDPEASDFGYDPNGYPKKITDALDKTTTFTYDERGNVTSITDAKGKKSTYTYDIFKRPLISRVPKDQEKGEMIETPAPVYDKNDNVTQRTMPNGAVYTYTYDKADQLIVTTEPKDTDTSPERKTTFEYDLVGNLKKQTEPKGNLTSDPDDNTVTYDYDPVDQLVKVTNSLGHKITYEYDNTGNLVKVTEPKGNETTEDPDDYVTTYTYDLNHRVTKVTDTKGHSVEYTYDHDGNRTTVKDKEGTVTTTVYDERGLVKEVRVPHDDGVERITRFEYDEVGNRTKVITPPGVRRQPPRTMP